MSSKKEIISQIRKCYADNGKVTRNLLCGKDKYCSRRKIDELFGSLTNAKRQAGVELGMDKLTDEEKNELNPSEYEDMFIGMLMSDSYIDYSNGNPCLRTKMTNKRYLEWISDITGKITTNITVAYTPEQAAKRDRDSGFRPNAKAKNRRCIYELHTRRLDWFNKLAEWYDSGSKKYPQDLELTPEIVRMWYCGDGGLSMRKNGYNGHASITCLNEVNRIDFLIDLFNKVGFYPKFDGDKALVFNVNDTDKMLNWMGDSPPGFEYKWEYKDYNKYMKLKEEAYN